MTGEKDPNYFESPSTDSETEETHLNSFERNSSHTFSSESSLGSLTDSIILSDSSTGYNTDPMSETENDILHESTKQQNRDQNKHTISDNANTRGNKLQSISPQDAPKEIKSCTPTSELTYKKLIEKDSDSRLKSTSNAYAAIGAII